MVRQGFNRDQLELFAAGENWSCSKCSVPQHYPNPKPEYMVERSERKTATSKVSLRILQWNADSIKLKIGELFERMKELDVDIDLVQERKLREKDKNPSIKGYSSLRAYRPGGRQGGGLIVYIKDNIAFETRRCWNRQTGNVDSSTIKIRLSKMNWIKPTNLYIPPNRETGTEETLVLDNLPSSQDCFVAGDIIAHSSLWGPLQPQDSRGDRIEEWLADKILLCATDGSTTRVNRGTAGESTPDVFFVPAEWRKRTEWSVGEGLGSDHLPMLNSIRFTVSTFQQTPQQTRWKTKEVNWADFTAAVKEDAKNWTKEQSVHTRARRFTESLIKAGTSHVGKTKPGKHKKVGMSAATRKHGE